MVFRDIRFYASWNDKHDFDTEWFEFHRETLSDTMEGCFACAVKGTPRCGSLQCQTLQSAEPRNHLHEASDGSDVDNQPFPAFYHGR